MGQFEMWQPTAPPPDAHFQITGSEFSQVLDVDIVPGMRITTEPGTMVYMEEGIGLGVDVGGCDQGCKRCCCLCESCFRLHLINNTDGPQKVGLAARQPAKVVPLDL